MGRRTNPLALRLQHLINWPSNIRHPFLSAYVKHIFQDYLIAEPGIRSSTNGIWINLTVFKRQTDRVPIEQHPKFLDRKLDFDKVQRKVEEGKADVRGLEDKKIGKLKAFHPYFNALYAGDDEGKPSGHRTSTPISDPAIPYLPRGPIHLRFNVITNPLLNAQICAQYAVEQLKKGRNLQAVVKGISAKMG